MGRDDEKSSDDADLDVLRAENEALKQQLAAQSAASQDRGPLWRRIIAVVLAVLAIITIVAALDAVWLKTTIQDEDQFVATFQNLPREEAVAEALSIRIADGVVEAIEVQAFIADTLPEPLGFIAAPLAGSIRDLIARTAGEIVRSDAVATAWTGALRVTHKAVSAVLSGNDRLLVAEEGRVVIDVDQIATVVVERVEATGLDLPDIEIDIEPIVLYESEELAAAQTVAQVVDTLGWFLSLVALLLVAAALFAAPDRRWMTAFLGFGTAIALLIHVAALRVGRSAILNGFEDRVSRDATATVWDTVFSRLIQTTWALLVVALLIGIAAWLSGPSHRAAGVRSWATRTIDGWRKPSTDEPTGFTAFVIEWKRPLQTGAVVLGVLFVLFGPSPSGLLVLATAVVVLAVVVVIEVIGGPAKTAPTPEDRVDA